MINNYYSIPSIPCSERFKITPSPGEKEEKCQGLNPDFIYKTLYPSKADPLINYNVTENVKGYGELIKTMQTDAISCAADCDNNKNCRHIEVSKPKNVCYLYSDTDTERKEIPLKDYEVEVFRKNDLLDGAQTCDVNDNFIEQPANYYPINFNKPIRKFDEKDFSKKECLTECANDENCKSVVYGKSGISCNQYSNTGSLNTAPSENSKLYSKKRAMVGNRFKAPDHLSNYYENYNKDGREGDSFCEYIEASDKCETSYIVGKGGSKEQPKNPKPPKDYLPPPSLCLPPDCIPQAPDDGKIGKLKINGNINIKCDPGDEDCQRKVTGVSYYSTDFMGLPTSYDEPNPSNPYLPYTSYFTEYKNLELTGDEMGNCPAITAMMFPEDCENWCKESPDCGGISYAFGTDGRAQCKYYRDVGVRQLRDNMKEKEYTNSRIKKGNVIDQNPNKYDMDKPYFNNFDNQQLNVKKVKACINDDLGVIARKKMDETDDVVGAVNKFGEISSEDDMSRYTKKKSKKNVPSTKNIPNAGNLEKFSNYEDSFFLDPEIESNSMDFSFQIPKSEDEGPNYGMCSNKKTRKNDEWGTNCPTPLTNCKNTEYGCCPDNSTAKNDIHGSNCLEVDKNCINSKYGCCPGTTISKKFLCDCDEGKMIDNYDRIANKYVNDGIIDTLYNIDKNECLDKCFNKKNCKTVLQVKNPIICNMYDKSSSSTGEYIVNPNVSMDYSKVYKKVATDKIRPSDNFRIDHDEKRPYNLSRSFKTSYISNPAECQKACLENTQCEYYRIQKDKDYCKLSSSDNYVTINNDELQYLNSIGYQVDFYKKKEGEPDKVDICETDFCKNNKNRNISNCELNERQTGDPDEYSLKKGSSCNEKNDCGSSQHCVNGFCQNVNPRFYNGLNNVQQAAMNEKSGSQLNDYICGKPGLGRSNKNNEKCSDSYDPVCGTDKITYKNDCQANNSGVKIQHYGPCENLIENFISQESRKPKFEISKLSMFIFIGILFIFIFVFAKKMT